MRMAQYETGGVDHEVEILVAIHVKDIVSLTVIDEDRIGIEVGSVSRGASRQITGRLLLSPAGPWSSGSVMVYLAFQCPGGHFNLLQLRSHANLGFPAELLDAGDVHFGQIRINPSPY